MRTLKTDHVNVSAATLSSATLAPVALIDAHIAMLFDDGSCLLDTGALAKRAISCLVELQASDRVLASMAADGVFHVLHILERDESGRARLSVPGAAHVSLSQSRIGIHAIESLELGSACDATLTAAGGTLSLNGRNLFVTVSESIVEQARHYVGKVGQYLLDVRELMRLHGNDALITATRDVKVDAERISMG